MKPISAQTFIFPAVLFAVAVAFTGAVWWWMGQSVAMPASPLAPGEKIQCVSYAPFRDAQNPLDPATHIPAAQIDEDLARLKMLTDCVRTYSIQHGLDQIPALARKHGIGVIQGLWLSSNTPLNAREIETTIKLANDFPDVIRSVVVGNEVLLRGEMSGTDLANIIREVKAKVKQPVTYADVWEFWLRHREIYDAVDFVTIHILPYWEDMPIAARDAAAHVDAIRRKMVAAFPGKDILIGETGFPSQGRMREGALPSPSNQAQVMHEILALAKRDNFRVNLIEAFDQPWKRYLEGTVGGYWGLLDAYNRVPKFRWGEALSNHPFWRWQAAGGVALVTLMFAFAWFVRTADASATGWLGVGIIAAVAGALTPLAIERIPIESFSPGGWIRSLALGAVAIAAPLTGAVAFTRGLSVPPLREVFAHSGEHAVDRWRLALGLVLAATVLLAIHAALGLVFDPRYKDFNYAPLTAAVAPFFLLSLSRRGASGSRPMAEMTAAWLLALSAVYVAFNESFANWQSLWLCAVFAAFALTLWRTKAARG